MLTKVIRAYPEDAEKIEQVRRQLEHAGGPRRSTADAVRHILDNGLTISLSTGPELEIAELEY